MQAGSFADELKLDRAACIALAKQAADLAEEVQRVDPNNPDAYSPQILHASVSGNLERAVQLAKQYVEIEPQNLSAHSGLGRALRVMGDMTTARASLEKALQFASPARRPAEVYVNLSRLAFTEDRRDDAAKWAQQAVDANPRFDGFHVSLALACARKGDEVQARKAAAEAMRLSPQLRLNFDAIPPWPGKEAAYKKYIKTQYLPAWRLAGLPE